jgi:hypothetical protein
MNLKPGDLVSSCHGFNSEVSKIEVKWTPVNIVNFNFNKLRKEELLCPRGTYVSDVLVFTKDGNIHYTDAPHCIFLAQSMKEWTNAYGKETIDQLLRIRMIDQRGVRLRNLTNEEKELPEIKRLLHPEWGFISMKEWPKQHSFPKIISTDS